MSPAREDAQTPGVGEFGAFPFWPDDLGWSFQFIRLVGQMYAGGSDFSEVYAVVRDLEAGDSEGWYAGFKDLADRLDERAASARRGGHLVSAREFWFRAANYYRASSFFFSPKDHRVPPSIDDRRRSFRSAAELCDAPLRPVEFPYEESSLPGYLISPLSRAKSTPAAIIFGGADAISEEMYFCLGKSLAERGYTVLAMDGPGQGEALRRGIQTRVDYEVPVGAAVDFLEKLPEVDSARITLVGQSLGGYYASRAAAFEKRLRACVIWGAFYSAAETFGNRIHRGVMPERTIELLCTIYGAESVADLLEKLEPMTLEGVAEKIECPTLVMHAQNDLLVPFEQAQRTFDQIPETVDKKLLVYPPGAPGCTHCQVDSLPAAQHDLCAWLDRLVAHPPA